MKTKPLGHSKISVSSLCFGGNVFGWTVDQDTSFKLLDSFVDGGGNFIDTADMYSRWVSGNSGGESEVIIGRWLQARKNRDKIVIATKVGLEMGPDKKGLSKKYIFQAIEDSLRRLQTDHIDLYISHRPDPETPIAETLEAYDQLIKQGKVRVIGSSNDSADQLREAIQTSEAKGLPRYQSLQPHYNLYDRADFEENLRPVCEEYGLAVTPYSALASGFLTGKYRSEADFNKSPRGGGMAKYMNPRGMEILAALDQVAKAHSTTPGPIALAWLMSRPIVTSTIASATSLEQLNDLIRSTRIELSAEEVQMLDFKSSAQSPGV